MNLLQFSLRNLRRNKRRTLITVISTAIAAASMVIYGSLYDGMLVNMKRNVTAVELGDIQIHHAQYRDDITLYNFIEKPSSIINYLNQKGFPAARRLLGYALGASSESSSGVEVRGIYPQEERLVTTIHSHVAEGKWLEASELNSAVIGRKLAKQLNLKIGSELVLLGQSSDGSMASNIYFVSGILKAIGSGIDRSAVFVHQSSFREFYNMPDGVHQIALRLPDTADLTAVSEELTLKYPDLDVKNWQQILPIVYEMLQLADVGMLIMIGIIYFALSLILINSILMSVFERIRELGILKALGLAPRSILLLILLESFWQTLMASFLALLVGLPGARWFETHPIDLSRFTDSFEFSGLAMEPYWYAAVSTPRVMQPIIFLIVIILLASLYPAAKAALIQPVSAINHR